MREFDYDFQIDGRPILKPDMGVSINASDLDSDESGRDESGVMHRFVLREKVLTFGLTYAVLTREEFLYLDSLLGGKSVFNLQCRDLYGQPTELQAYCSKYGIVLYDAKTGVYKNLKFNIIQC